MKTKVLITGFVASVAVSCGTSTKEANEKLRPNILIAIIDDQSFAHTSFAGCKFVNTPACDRVAKNVTHFFKLATGKRTEFELYRVKVDPDWAKYDA